MLPRFKKLINAILLTLTEIQRTSEHGILRDLCFPLQIPNQPLRIIAIHEYVQGD